MESKKILNSCLQFNAVYQGAQNINPDVIARELQNKFNMKTEFGNDPLIAAFTALTTNIFKRLGFVHPTGLYFKNLRKTYYDKAYGITIADTYDNALYDKFHTDFPLRSVIINKAHNWDNIQEEMIKARNTNHFSTPHFLSIFIHEYVHSAHLDNLMKKCKDGIGMMHKFSRKFRNKDTICMIQKETSNYGAQKPCELVAEEMTELIVNSLVTKTILPNEMIFRMERAKEPLMLDKLIDACWNGDLKQVEAFRKRRFNLFNKFNISI